VLSLFVFFTIFYTCPQRATFFSGARQEIVERIFAAPATYMWPFFESKPGAWNGGFLDAASFDVASDAFATLKDLLTRHKGSGAVKGFLEANYERMFGEPEDQVGSSSSSTTPTTAAAVATALGGSQAPPPQTPTLELPLPACPPTATNAAPEGSSAVVASELEGGAGAVDAASSGNMSSSSSGGEKSSSSITGSVSTAASVDVRACRLVGLYGGLLGSERNFFTRRQSLKLLAELLLDRTNFAVSSGGTLSFPLSIIFSHALDKVMTVRPFELA